MTTPLTRPLPTAQEVALARESGRALSGFLQTLAETLQIEILDERAQPTRFGCQSRPCVTSSMS